MGSVKQTAFDFQVQIKLTTVLTSTLKVTSKNSDVQHHKINGVRILLFGSFAKKLFEFNWAISDIRKIGPCGLELIWLF